MPRLSARSHLLGLIAAALVPVWLFAAYLLAQYAFREEERFENQALQTARQVSLVVEGELARQLTMLQGLAKSPSLASGDLAELHAEAAHLVEDTDDVVLMRDRDGRQLFNTRQAFGADLPPARTLTPAELGKMEANQPAVGDVYLSRVSQDYRIPVDLPVKGPHGESWLLTISVPTAHIRDVMMPTVPSGWMVAVGDSQGQYVARSELHEEVSGKPGNPQYVRQVVGRSGTFTATNFKGLPLLAGYYRSDFSGWFYSANVPLSTVQAPLWRSLGAIGAIGLVAMLASGVLAYAVGAQIASAARGLAARAEALGHGRPVEPLFTGVAEFAAIADALSGAARTLAERTSEMQTVLETAPVAVWFTYDPKALQVIRNRFAAALMGVPTQEGAAFGTPSRVIDTLASREGQRVPREERPLSRAMRGHSTDNEEFSYTLLDGTERILLTSARPIRDSRATIIGAVQISLDITERKRGEEQRRLLARELSHRVKNTLAVVQAIASQTMRSAASIADARTALSSRLASLAKAHDLLTQENWTGAELGELVRTALTPHAGLDRFRLQGGPVRLPPSLALSLALALHELATNAIKYGALSCEKGNISISWTTQERPDGTHLRLEWREQDGPTVTATDRQGFGTRMLSRLLDAERDGHVTLVMNPEGLSCLFEAALERPDDDSRGPESQLSGMDGEEGG